MGKKSLGWMAWSEKRLNGATGDTETMDERERWVDLGVKKFGEKKGSGSEDT